MLRKIIITTTAVKYDGTTAVLFQTLRSVGNQIQRYKSTAEVEAVLRRHAVDHTVLHDYLPAFTSSSEPFLTFYSSTKMIESYTRTRFLTLSLQATNLLRDVLGAAAGDRHVHYFSGNAVEDLVLRTASILVGTVPVTVNWQADSIDKILYKIRTTGAKFVFVDPGTPLIDIDAIKKSFPNIRVIDATMIRSTDAISASGLSNMIQANGVPSKKCARCIIFTSGTTGDPKGVELSYENYRVSQLTLESLVFAPDCEGRMQGSNFVPIAVNPMHHGNTTSISDWSLRRKDSHLHLVEKYNSEYWAITCSAILGCDPSVVSSMTPAEAILRIKDRSSSTHLMPIVSRHIDFLEILIESGTLGFSPGVLKECLNSSVLLLGSAPVGPSTTKRLIKYANKLPTVRFGSTETTLQVCGIPLSLKKEKVMDLFQAGWNNSFNGVPCAGYYIGREHPPYTSVRIVQSVNKDSSTYLRDCVESQPGYIITRGNNLMTGYVGRQKDSTSVVSEDGWYLNLGDIGFWLGTSETRDIYWQSRDSQILIRGGANYAFEQISAELKAAVCRKYQLSENSVALAVCGIREKSEHEDECCVILELLDESAKKKQIDIEKTFIEYFRQPGVVSKGSKPDKFIVGKIPMIATKHVVDVAAMVTFWKSQKYFSQYK